jgi:hypothetical protein
MLTNIDPVVLAVSNTGSVTLMLTNLDPVVLMLTNIDPVIRTVMDLAPVVLMLTNIFYGPYCNEHEPRGHYANEFRTCGPMLTNMDPLVPI